MILALVRIPPDHRLPLLGEVMDGSLQARRENHKRQGRDTYQLLRSGSRWTASNRTIGSSNPLSCKEMVADRIP